MNLDQPKQFINMNMSNEHTFHIPVMGLGYTIDTPIKVAQYGISSVISLVDDLLVEQMRKFYSEEFGFTYKEIPSSEEDSRSKRITSYLDMVDDIVKIKVNKLKKSVMEVGGEFEKYISLLPPKSVIRENYQLAKKSTELKSKFVDWVNDHLPIGDIDVNIMTKLDKVNYKDGEALSNEHNDAHIALKAFAESKLSSSLVLSAGMSPRLYTYLEKFKDFFPNGNGDLKKKVILKVSDFRSALVQGKILANKGIWISEYRIESGVNCGGHAFPTNGVLFGPILEEFKEKRETLFETCKAAYYKALEKKEMTAPQEVSIKVTAQGGVGTAEEHQLLLNDYKMDSIGWGSPFMVCPDVVSIDQPTMKLLVDSGEDDFYLSYASPMGVPFNNVRQPEDDKAKRQLFDAGQSGFKCVKQFLKFDTEFTEKPICVASKQYHKLKVEQIEAQDLSPDAREEAVTKLLEKDCLCVGLGVSSLKSHEVKPAFDTATVVCPGPNLAYYSKESNLQEMVAHIYGQTDLIGSKERPNLFRKEQKMYEDIYATQAKNLDTEDKKAVKTFEAFNKNMEAGMAYYEEKGL